MPQSAGLARRSDAPARQSDFARGEDSYRDVIHAFGEVAAALGDSRELDSLLHLIAEKICDLVGVSRCSLYLHDESSGLFRGQVGHWHHDIDKRIKRLVTGIDADGFTAQILATKSPVVVDDTRADPRPIRSTMREWKIRSMLGVPMVLHEEIIGIIYLDDGDRPRSYDEEDAAIASAFADLAAVAISQAQLTSDLRSRLLTVARQNRAMRKAADAEDRLTSLALDGSGVQAIADAVADLTGKAVAIHDASHRRLAGSPRPDSDDGELPRLLEPAVRDHPEVVAALEVAASGDHTLVEPLPRAGISRRSLVVPVRVGSDPWGLLLLAEHSRLTTADMRIARRAATIVAWEMAAERRALAATDDARAALVAEVTRGSRDRSAMLRRAEYLGVDLGARRFVGLLSGSEGIDAGEVAPRLDALAEETLDALAAESEDGIVVLLPTAPLERDGESANDAARALFDRLTGELDGSAPRVALSNPCESVDEYKGALAAARQVRQCMDSVCGPEVRTLTAADLGPGRVLFAGSDRGEIERFTAETLGPLLDESKANDELLRTLVAFFHAGRSVRKAAIDLDVHENTIRYRLGRLDSIGGPDVLNDAEAQFNAQLAVLALDLQGRLKDP